MPANKDHQAVPDSVERRCQHESIVKSPKTTVDHYLSYPKDEREIFKENDPFPGARKNQENLYESPVILVDSKFGERKVRIFSRCLSHIELTDCKSSLITNSSNMFGSIDVETIAFIHKPNKISKYCKSYITLYSTESKTDFINSILFFSSNKIVNIVNAGNTATLT